MTSGVAAGEENEKAPKALSTLYVEYTNILCISPKKLVKPPKPTFFHPTLCMLMVTLHYNLFIVFSCCMIVLKCLLLTLIDIPMSVGVIDIKTNPSQLNAVEFLWDPTKCTSAFIQVWNFIWLDVCVWCLSGHKRQYIWTAKLLGLLFVVWPLNTIFVKKHRFRGLLECLVRFFCLILVCRKM